MITQAIGAGSIFPSRKTCVWVEQADGLEAEVCEDGEVMMWRDDQHNVWLPSEKPPARRRKMLRHHAMTAAPSLGAGPLPGICTPHKAVPLTKIRRLQNALRGLATRVRDGSLRVTADGLIGTRTVAAVNHAMVGYVGMPHTIWPRGSLRTRRSPHSHRSSPPPSTGRRTRLDLRWQQQRRHQAR